MDIIKRALPGFAFFASKDYAREAPLLANIENLILLAKEEIWGSEEYG